MRNNKHKARTNLGALIPRLSLVATAIGLAACGQDDGHAATPATPPAASGRITVAGNHVYRDGVLWVPHAVQLVAFVAPPAAQVPPFVGAYAHYGTAELSALKAWGADSVRFQLSQPGADPTNAAGRYDPAFVQQFVGAVKAARAIGLAVIVSIQDESQSGEPTPATLPNATTIGVWQNLAPMLNGDDGIVYELFNEPRPLPNAVNWHQWAVAMNAVVAAIRATGATNTLLADGLNFAESLDGVVPLTDPLHAVFYSTHPYFHKPDDETLAVWMRKFGNTAATLPVIVGEWTTATTYYCGPGTPAAALRFLQYIASLDIGLVAVTYDFGLPKYGGIVSDYAGTPTSYANGLSCGSEGFGPGKLIQAWYRTGAVPRQLE